jgi:serine protease Do
MASSVPLPLTGDAAVWLAERALKSVVQVDDGGRGTGAGVAIDRRGLIVTNAHVVRGRRATATTNDGRRMDGKVVARDDALDLAAIQVESDDLHTLESGDSQSLRPGQLVLAIGHPLGVNDAVTVGIVTRPPEPDDPRELIASNITLNRGNSGGPLLDASGKLIGINAMVAGPGLGLAVPAHIMRRFLAAQVDPRPHIGVTVQPVEGGLIVTDVQPESPAEAAGILPGDIIAAVAGHPAGGAALLDGLIAAGIGGTMTLDLLRACQPLTVTSAVAARA